MFLYRLQNNGSFNPSWNEVFDQYPEFGVEDIINFSGAKQNCKPPWARKGYNGLSNNRLCLEDGLLEFSQFSNFLSNWFTVKDAAAFACVANIKDIFVHSVLSYRLVESSNCNQAILGVQHDDASLIKRPRVF